jgi:hypothetical protein
VLLQTIPPGALSHLVPNTCVNLDVRELKMTVTSVRLSVPDEERTITVVAYGSFG